ncbi:MAG TPA: tetratricopeptide repeat protein [Pirellulaceae bacterium]|nr:tetratricopeptide repeat protein [Pirellulaceae bacterium]HMP69883.1 tetratricopeptide repeat protein [Pirellulaceae bacterium]
MRLCRIRGLLLIGYCFGVVIGLANSSIVLGHFGGATETHGLPISFQDESIYIQGLELLRKGNWKEAAEALTRAIESDDEQADYYLARGVANTLAEDFTAAEKDLARADRLRPNHAPTRLWRASVVAMQGELFEDTKIFPAATRDPYETAVRETSRQYGDLTFQKKLNPQSSDPRWQQSRAQAKSRFVDLGAQFVQRIMPERTVALPEIKARGFARLWAGTASDAKLDFAAAVKADLNDGEARLGLACCHYLLGELLLARRDLTELLTGRFDYVEAWATRSLVYTALGQTQRAHEDWQTAMGLDAQRAQTFIGRLKQLPPPQSQSVVSTKFPAGLVNCVAALERSPADWEEVLIWARGEVLNSYATRQYADDKYQRDLFVLRKRVADQPNDADAWVNLGDFLYREAMVVLTEWVEPRALPRPYRFQTEESQKLEIAEAERIIDVALRLNPNHMGAPAIKAACWLRRGDSHQAEPLLKRALENQPDDPRLLELFSILLDQSAAALEAQASDLRSVKSWSDWYYVYFRYPSAAEKAAAQQLSLEAKKLWRLADEYLRSAANKLGESPAGHYLQSTIALRDNNPQAALEHLKQSVDGDPHYREAWRRLIQVYGQLKQIDEMYQAQFTAANQWHTTAGPMLKLAWLKMNRTQWTSAARCLQPAIDVDPADPRVAAYMGLVELGKENHHRAAAWLLAATALARANAELNGVEIASTSESVVSPNEIALLVQLSRVTAELLLKQKMEMTACEILSPIAGLHARVSEADRYRVLPESMLPELQPNEHLMPEATNLETLVAWCRLIYGQALARQKVWDDARVHFEWVADFEARKPSVLDVGSAIRIPQKIAQIELVKLAVAQGDLTTARRLMMNVGRPRDLPPEAANDLQELIRTIR